MHSTQQPPKTEKTGGLQGGGGGQTGPDRRLRTGGGDWAAERYLIGIRGKQPDARRWQRCGRRKSGRHVGMTSCAQKSQAAPPSPRPHKPCTQPPPLQSAEQSQPASGGPPLSNPAAPSTHCRFLPTRSHHCPPATRLPTPKYPRRYLHTLPLPVFSPGGMSARAAARYAS